MMKLNQEDKNEFNRWLYAMIFPLTFIFIMTVIHSLEVALDTSFYRLGVLPLSGRGLIGVLTSPLIHKDWEHLINNSLPLFVMGTMLVYFHRDKAMELFLAMYIIGGLWLWLIGRPVYHIGASGLVYALAAYHITYGFVIRNPPMLALGFFVISSYGSMIWFVLPLVEEVSWEAHLCGALSGVLLAIYFGKEYKKSLLQVRGSMTFTHNSQEGEEVNYVYHFKSKE